MSDPMIDHDATREILAAAQAYADSQVRLVKVTETGHHKPPEWYEALRLANRQGQDARAHLESTIRRALARGAAIEVAAVAVVLAKDQKHAADKNYFHAPPDAAIDARRMLEHRMIALDSAWDDLRAALVAGAGETTEGE